MTDEERRIYDALVKINQFGVDEAASFSGIATAQFSLVGDIVDSIQASGSEQMSAIGDSGEQFGIKSLKREALREAMSRTAKTARSMVYAFPGIDDQFRMPRNRNDADLLNAGRAFITNGLPLQADFIAYGLPNHWFDGELETAANEFEATFSTTASAQADRAEATADIHDWVQQGMRARRTLDGIVRNVFYNDAGKLAAWQQAAHIERPPKKSTPPAPPTP